MILVDTSVWIDHLRSNEPTLAMALQSGEVLGHPFVVGELACGNLRNRAAVMVNLRELPVAAVATDLEAIAFIDGRSLMGLGIGYIDVHLLASAALTPDTRLWTRDRRLAEIADRFRLGFRENG